MNRPPYVAPSVLAADWLHLAIMDGRFVPRISFGPTIRKTMWRRTNLIGTAVFGEPGYRTAIDALRHCAARD